METGKNKICFSYSKDFYLINKSHLIHISAKYQAIRRQHQVIFSVLSNILLY